MTRAVPVDLARRQMRTAKLLAAAAGLGLVLLGWRLVHINTALSPKLIALKDAQYHSRSVIPARRGTIFDARGRVLAGSRELHGVFADPALIEDLPATAARAAAVLGMDAGELEEHIRQCQTPRFCWLKHGLGKPEAEALQNANLPGVGIVAESVRHYPLGNLAGQVLGFVSPDGQGLEGVELQYNKWLAGRDGQAWTVRDTHRRPIRATSDGGRYPIDPQDGGHILLTIDGTIQSIVEAAIAAQVEKFEAERAVGLVMDPKTGDVLAMACHPPFSPGEYNQFPPEARRNRTVTDMVEPGSTFKPFVATGAMALGAAKPGEVFYCHDGLRVIGRRRLHDSHPYGNLTFEDIIAKSSNIGMAILGDRMGNAALHRTVCAYGFGEVTGIDFPGEAPGRVLPLAAWTSYSTSSVPMGQEIAVTPLQLITAFSAIVNDGILLKPRLVRAKLSATGDVVEEFAGPDPVRRVLPEEVARFFTHDVLVGVVNGTTSAHNAAVDGYQVLGKTGTAQVPYEDRRGYEPNAYLGSFVGAAPADDPQVAVLVMIRKPNPRIGYYGGTISAPAVSEILAATLPYLEVPPQRSGTLALAE